MTKRNLVGLRGIFSLVNWNAAMDLRLGKVIHQTLPSPSPCARAAPPGNETQKGLGTKLAILLMLRGNHKITQSYVHCVTFRGVVW